jgi:membrane-bound lytic murein transglycosylase A
MIRRSAAAIAAVLAGAGLMAALFSPVEAGAASVGDARLTPVAFTDLAGWPADDHAAALATFRRSCDALLTGAPALRPAGDTGENLLAACAKARSVPPEQARRFFEENFEPHRVTPPSGEGFLTGYFEPEYEGSLTPDDDFATPLLARPADLVTIPQGETLPGLTPGLQAARQTPAGYEPYPDRAAIEDGALTGVAEAIVWLRHPSEAFIVHVQGSARIRLPDGRILKVAYAGRNGQPYTSIGRIIVERGHIALDDMSLERLVGWLKANPGEGREIMRRNSSYIFFRVADELSADDGPIGGAGIPLTPGRSLAVDRTLWRYGLPFWLEGTLPQAQGPAGPLARLMIAQDTGSAILGPARGDFFTGSGAEAGTQAGLMRHATRFVVLLPKPATRP